MTGLFHGSSEPGKKEKNVPNDISMDVTSFSRKCSVVANKMMDRNEKLQIMFDASMTAYSKFTNLIQLL